jgi:hypothetical protein
MIKHLVLTTIFMASLLGGCKRQRLSPAERPSLENEARQLTVVDTISDSLSLSAAFTYLSTRSRISIKSKGQNIDNATVAFRVKKDSAIWVSASVLGLEVMRGILSTEGVRLLDRVNKVYIEASYRTLASRLGFPLDYPLLQGFFLADVPTYTGTRFEIQNDLQHTLVRQADEYLAIYNMIDRSSRKTTRMEAIDLIGGSKAQAEYEYNPPGATAILPYDAKLNLAGRSVTSKESTFPIEISILHNSVTITDSTLSFPFQIPNNYKKAF